MILSRSFLPVGNHNLDGNDMLGFSKHENRTEATRKSRLPATTSVRKLVDGIKK